MPTFISWKHEIAPLAVPTTATTTQYVVPNADGVTSTVFVGTGFTYSGTGFPTGGTITSMSLVVNSDQTVLQTMTNNMGSVSSLHDFTAAVAGLQSQVSWLGVVNGNAVTFSATQVRLLNTDGTFTDVLGSGFSKLGDVLSGTVTSIQHLAANGTTVLDNITGLNVNFAVGASALLPDVFSQQFYLQVGAGDNTVQAFTPFVTNTDLVYTNIDGTAGSDHYIGQPLGGPPDNPFARHVDLNFASSSVTVDLVTGQATGGAGTKVLTEISGASGSDFNDTLTGDDNDNSFQGEAGNDIISGGGGRDFIDGGLGDDILDGGAGNNDWAYYTIDLTSGVTVSLAVSGPQNTGGAGIDTLSNFENILGSSFNDNLTGTSGDNILDGGMGADALAGGAGNDTYMVDDAGDVVTENANEGADTVQASVDYTLTANVENLILTGSANLSGSGNALANTITGNSGDNVLNGMGGADTMIGGAGNDSYFVDNIGDVVTESVNEGSDTIYATADYTLSANVENLVMQGSAGLQGYGNGLSNAIYGNSGDNTLDGGVGTDFMAGGNGNDSYFVDNPGDVITENANEGSDIVYSTASLHLGADIENLVLQGSADLQGFGNALANAIYGNSGSNILDGDVGADLMVGGAGNDSYYVDNAGDVITENLNEGTDTVYSTAHLRLTANLENLLLQGNADLQGYGNTLSNAIYGNSGNNLLDGDAGADSMYGGAGNDTYYVDNIADVVVENSNEGFDTVHTTANLVLAANCETLILDGSADLQGYGNGQSNAIYGNSGNNLLDGGAGGDSMYGGAGNDTYYVDDPADVIVENLNEGTDTVFSTANLVLGANVEQLVLQGPSDLQGYGNSLTNAIYGNSGANVLDGGGGADSLTGNGGNDTFVFHAGEGNGDTVIDFTGNGAAAGDALLFVGYGVGATFTNVDATHWEVNYNGGASHDVIAFTNSASIDPTDYSFI